ncbi:methyltransferase type 11 [Pleomorphomonas diazotrophica]|uniref:Arsenite methyltransferase n=1 Tax=Pleomorphomonas diazotrophica TaxID=1166257 RepID=A0A2N3M2R3_9HYPH|nr:methyltransferase type 11 [Pleomorphomonas diazotrophica]
MIAAGPPASDGRDCSGSGIVADQVAAVVRDYYGARLTGQGDLKTGACCSSEPLTPRLRSIVATIHPDVLNRFYGCGSPMPDDVDGLTVLDLGCGSGRDVFMLSALVGENGRSIGVDMTPEQLAIGRAHQAEQARVFGHRTSNVSFLEGRFENLSSLGIADASIDVVISNCALNLSEDKARVFAEIRRVLKPGGELLFSDVFASRRLPADVASDPLLVAECLGGALYVEDFRRLMAATGWADYRLLAKRTIAIGHPYAELLVGPTTFWSMTVRAFKLDGLEDCCEDYGQVATYLGTMPDSPTAFLLDDHHRFIAGKPMLVCGNTAAMIGESRFRRHFRVDGDRSVHFGRFDCSPSESRAAIDAAPASACC